MITWSEFKKSKLSEYDIKPNSDFALKLECAFNEMEMELQNDLKVLEFKNKQLKAQLKGREFACEQLLDACEYYLPILEERLSCGSYMKQKINWYLTKYKQKHGDNP